MPHFHCRDFSTFSSLNATLPDGISLRSPSARTAGGIIVVVNVITILLLFLLYYISLYIRRHYNRIKKLKSRRVSGLDGELLTDESARVESVKNIPFEMDTSTARAELHSFCRAELYTSEPSLDKNETHTMQDTKGVDHDKHRSNSIQTIVLKDYPSSEPPCLPGGFWTQIVRRFSIEKSAKSHHLLYIHLILFFSKLTAINHVITSN